MNNLRIFRSLLFIGILLLAVRSVAQNISIAQGGTVNACGGTFTDDGVGGAYTDTPYTITICPDVPGDVVKVTFAAFSLQTSPGNGNSDLLYVYDGVNNQAPPLGPYSGSQANLQITATINNTSGCLTFVFDPNGPANAGSPGWEGILECTTPCDNPVLASAITNPLPEGPTQSVAICQGASVSFSGAGSQAQPGFTIASYTWDFADGTTATGINQTHTFNEPGEYIVNLTVADNNECTNLNVIPLQVLVSTIPSFPDIEDLETEYCFGDEIVLDAGEITSPTWTALPPQVVSGTTYLADGAGFSFSSSIVYDFFEPGATLESCDDLLGILVNMEHSYMGDLGILVTCPNGTSVDLIEWGNNGGGGTYLGEATDDNGTNNLIPGVGYDYIWSPTATNGTWGDNAGDAPPITYINSLGQSVTQDVLPSGVYEPAGDLCDLVGCPLNGAWTFVVTDNLGADNGYIFAWGLNLNPELFPGVTTFTPAYGTDSDSTYWTGPNIDIVSGNGDVITLDIPATGSYDYTYYATNDFGCTFDTTITITVTQAPLITAGPDMTYSCGDVQLMGGFQGMPTPSCSQDAGNYTHCYVDNQNYFVTYCPDNPGDGTAMRVTFTAGSTENFFDEFYVYDGPDSNSPILAGPLYGNLAGLTFTATNAGGCITFGVTPDGSVSCQSGSQTEWAYSIDCTTGGPEYTWQWTPSTGLSNNAVPQPTVQNLTQNTTYTLTGFPVGHPGCSSTDQVVVSIDPLGDPGEDNTITVCSTDSPFQLLDELLGTPVTTGSWTGPTNNPIPSGTFNPLTDPAGEYVHTVAFANCETSATLTINIAGPTQITIPNDTTLCFNGDASLDLYTLSFGQPPFQYEWTYNGTTVSNLADFQLQGNTDSGEACLTVTDACQYVVNDCFFVTVLPEIDVQFEADTTAQCFPEPFNLSNLVDPSLYSQALWEISDGTQLADVVSFEHYFENPGSYDVSLTLTSSTGCTYNTTIADYLTSYSPPVAGYDPGPQPTNSLATEITFDNQTLGDIVEYSWTFGNSPALGFSDLESPVFNFPLGVGGIYPVTLQVTDIHNCTDSVQGLIYISDVLNAYIPTAFTPNGDGINDVLFFIGNDINPDKFEFQIFNRWGDLIFESTDPNQPWTGDVNNGEYFADNGVYLWRAVIVSNSTGERKELNGHFLLFR